MKAGCWKTARPVCAADGGQREQRASSDPTATRKPGPGMARRLLGSHRPGRTRRAERVGGQDDRESRKGQAPEDRAVGAPAVR